MKSKKRWLPEQPQVIRVVLKQEQVSFNSSESPMCANRSDIEKTELTRSRIFPSQPSMNSVLPSYSSSINNSSCPSKRQRGYSKRGLVQRPYLSFPNRLLLFLLFDCPSAHPILSKSGGFSKIGYSPKSYSRDVMSFFRMLMSSNVLIISAGHSMGISRFIWIWKICPNRKKDRGRMPYNSLRQGFELRLCHHLNRSN